MKVFLTLLLILGLAAFQSFLLPVNFILVLVIVFSLWQKAPVSFVWVFLVGLLLDLFSFGHLGLSAIIFVSLDFLLKLYRQRFSLDHPLVLSFVMLISYGLYSWLTGGKIRFGEAGVLLVIILLWRFFQKDLFLALGDEREKLKI